MMVLWSRTSRSLLMHRDEKDYFQHLHFLATPPGNRCPRAAGRAVRRARAPFPVNDGFQGNRNPRE